MARVDYLPWDSDFFGLKIGRLTLGPGDQTIDGLRREIGVGGYHLCYVFAGADADPDVAVAAGAVRVDERTLFELDLSAGEPPPVYGDDEPPPTADDLPELKSLARQSGEFSRFRVDPAMPADAWIRLYDRWAEQSLSGGMADAVLVERIDGRVAAFLTVKRAAGNGSIGLFAVDAAARGRGLGKRLLARGEGWFRSQGCGRVTVVTQGANVPARHIYESAGYRVSDVTRVLHFWVPDA